MINRIINRYMEERRDRLIEKHLAGAMYQAASLAGYTSFENVLKAMAESDYGALSNEFKKAYNGIRSGESVELALEKMVGRNGSKMLNRAINIMLSGYRTGIDLSEALREAAEDIEKTLTIDRENSASIVVEKYTILFAGGIIVPLILGSMISLVSSIDLSSLQEFGMGGQSREILENAVFGNQIYVVIYSIIASVFVAYQENRIENSLVYVLFLLPTSLVLFNLARAFGLS
jgi:pilus assembly protein TadC